MKGTQIIAVTVKKDIGIIIYYEANVHLIDLCISEFPSEIFQLLIAQIFGVLGFPGFRFAQNLTEKIYEFSENPLS